MLWSKIPTPQLDLWGSQNTWLHLQFPFPLLSPSPQLPPHSTGDHAIFCMFPASSWPTPPSDPLGVEGQLDATLSRHPSPLHLGADSSLPPWSSQGTLLTPPYLSFPNFSFMVCFSWRLSILTVSFQILLQTGNAWKAASEACSSLFTQSCQHNTK